MSAEGGLVEVPAGDVLVPPSRRPLYWYFLFSTDHEKSPHGGVMCSRSAHLMQLCCDFWSRTYVWVRVTTIDWVVQVALRVHAKNHFLKLKKTLSR